MKYLIYLAEFLLQPIGIIFVTLAIIAIVLALRHAALRWCMVGVVIYLSSMVRYYDKWIGFGPEMTFPLNMMIQYGRPIAIVGMSTILIVAALGPQSGRNQRIPLVLYFFLAMQIAIFSKLMSLGSFDFAFLSLFTNLLIFVAMTQFQARWTPIDQDFIYQTLAIATVPTFFILAFCYQAAFELSPVVVKHGRLNGTTGNPQHAAVLLSGSVPALLYLLKRASGMLAKIGIFTILCAVLIGVAWTGSRTGGIMALLAVLIWVLSYKGTVKKTVFIIGIFGAFGFGLYHFSISTAQRLLSIEDTRSDIWIYLFEAFLRNPFFGANIEEERLGYGENSWLSMGASVGIVGLLPMVLFGISLVVMIWRVWRRRKNLNDPSAAYLVVSALSILLIGSISEAYLLGNINAPVLYIFIYSFIGLRLIEMSDVGKARASQRDKHPVFLPVLKDETRHRGL